MANCAVESSGICIDWFDTTIDTFTPCLLDTSRILFLDGDLTFDCCDWTVGDVNESGIINVADAVYLVQYIFAGGPPPKPVVQSGNVNCAGVINVADAVYLVQYIFAGGPPAPCECNDLL
jgi:hypothetical protein